MNYQFTKEVSVANKCIIIRCPIYYIEKKYLLKP